MVSILPCTNAMAERMVTDERFKLVSFTGSAAVGWMLKNKAGKKRVVLELGGNAGGIVEPDADLDHAADRCAVGGYAYSGQTCLSVQRIYAHESVYQAFLGKLLQRVAALKAGNPAEDTTVIGPLIDEGAAKRVESWVREATAAGAKVRIGGKREGGVVEGAGLTHGPPQMEGSCPEGFGPLVTVGRGVE